MFTRCKNIIFVVLLVVVIVVKLAKMVDVSKLIIFWGVSKITFANNILPFNIKLLL